MFLSNGEELSKTDFDLSAVGCKVFSILTDMDACRDDDRMLLAEIWRRESGCSSEEPFLKLLTSGVISHPESVRRMRQKIQEVHPPLRGKKYDSRHNMEAVICQQLTFFDKWGTKCH